MKNVLVSLLMFATSAATADDAGPPKTPKVRPGETAVYVADMHCATCAKKVASRLFKIKGVMKVRTDVESDVAILTPQPKKQIDHVAVWSALEKAGYPAVKLVGPQGVYVADEESKQPVKVTEVPAASPR